MGRYYYGSIHGKFSFGLVGHTDLPEAIGIRNDYEAYCSDGCGDDYFLVADPFVPTEEMKFIGTAKPDWDEEEETWICPDCEAQIYTRHRYVVDEHNIDSLQKWIDETNEEHLAINESWRDVMKHVEDHKTSEGDGGADWVSEETDNVVHKFMDDNDDVSALTCELWIIAHQIKFAFETNGTCEVMTDDI